MKAPKPRPCDSCPYRCDVPSGIWSQEEYEKLPKYDLPLDQQPVGAFGCHLDDGRLCGGWVATHDMTSNIAMIFQWAFGHITREDMEKVMDYTSPVPLFETGQEARDHGMRDLEKPSARAREVVQKLLRQGKVMG